MRIHGLSAETVLRYSKNSNNASVQLYKKHMSFFCCEIAGSKTKMVKKSGKKNVVEKKKGKEKVHDNNRKVIMQDRTISLPSSKNSFSDISFTNGF